MLARARVKSELLTFSTLEGKAGRMTKIFNYNIRTLT